jgi:hypothetical protein
LISNALADRDSPSQLWALFKRSTESQTFGLG